MLKLGRYLKTYILGLILAVILLVGQAVLELNLPNRMSDIVNTGIQKSGIEEVAPRVITANTFALLNLFMDEEDFTVAGNAYTLYSELEPTEKLATDKTFPEAREENALVLTAVDEHRELTDGAFGRAGYAMMSALQDMAREVGGDIGTSDEVSADFDLEALEELVPVLASMPQETLDAAIDKSHQVPATISESVAAVLNKAIYQNLGADTGRMQTMYILKVGLLMLGLSLATAACAVLAGFFFSRLGAGIARDLRRDVFAKVSGFTNAEMDNFSTASLITRTTNDVTQVQMMYTMGMRFLIFAPVMAIGGVVMALRKSVGMSWVVALAVIIIVCVIGVMFVVVMPKFKKMQALLDRLNLVARENLSGLMVVRAFANQDFQQKRFDRANKELTANSLFVGRSMILLMPIIMLLMNGIVLLIIWVGADQIAQSNLQVGDMMAFVQYAMQIIMSFLFIAMIFIMLPRASVSAERIDEVLKSKSVILDPQDPVTLGGRARGEVAFKNVSFRYGGAEDDVLHDVSFTAKPGQTTAFIGATGSGKSTLVNLIPRFYDVSEGQVTLDGVDVRQLTQHKLRDNIGYVPQKGLLFSGDIDSNLRFGNEEASDAQLRTAAEIAQATEFIDNMDEGFETEISQGGTNVSGGQRQRLSIARALAKEAPVYIFDDSFSALDFRTDAKLRAALKPHTEQSTVLIVAQRISSIMHAEQIVVMENGRVAGIGKHAELMKDCEPYREIAESQLSKEELA